VGNATKLPHDYMSAELTAKEAGFAYVYISHENATLVEGYFACLPEHKAQAG
jgi:hypothetical protein